MSFQKIIIMGNIGKIEQRFSPSGDSVVNFSVAVNDRYKKKDGTQVDDVEWFRCVSFGKQSEVIAQYFSKGSRIMVEGSLKTRQWQDDTGATRYNTDLKVSNFSFIDKKGIDNTTQPSQTPQNRPQQQQNGSDNAHRSNMPMSQQHPGTIQATDYAPQQQQQQGSGIMDNNGFSDDIPF